VSTTRDPRGSDRQRDDDSFYGISKALGYGKNGVESNDQSENGDTDGATRTEKPRCGDGGSKRVIELEINLEEVEASS
jgi:hypothetical protein